jgi:hypothetical protein
MDNGKPHTCPATQDHIDTLESEVKFLSPYSYMLNPIEFSFSKIKNSVRQMNMTADTSFDMISIVAERITEQDSVGWYRSIRRNAALAMDGHIFN